MRLIDADKLKAEWEDPDALCGVYTAYHFIACIDAQPTADVRENVHGEWIEIPDEVFASTYKCSVCGCAPLSDGYDVDYALTPYCPNCGADMRGEEHE